MDGKLILKPTSAKRKEYELIPFTREECRMCLTAEGKPVWASMCDSKWPTIATDMHAWFLVFRSSLLFSGDTDLVGITATNEQARNTNPVKARHTIGIAYYPEAHKDLAMAECIFRFLLANYGYANKDNIQSHNLAVASAYLALCLESMFFATADFIADSAKEGKNAHHVKIYDDALKDTKKEMKAGYNSLSPEDQMEAVKVRIAAQVQNNSATSHVKGRKYLPDFCTAEMKAKMPSYFSELGDADAGDTVEIFILNASRNVFTTAKNGKPGMTSKKLREEWDGKIPGITLDAFAKTLDENQLVLNQTPLIVNGQDRVIDPDSTATGYSRFGAVVTRGGIVSMSIEFLAALKLQIAVNLPQKIVVYAKKPPSSKQGTKHDRDDTPIVAPMTLEELADNGFDCD